LLLGYSCIIFQQRWISGSYIINFVEYKGKTNILIADARSSLEVYYLKRLFAREFHKQGDKAMRETWKKNIRRQSKKGKKGPEIEKIFVVTEGDLRRGALCEQICKMDDAALGKLELFLSELPH